MPVRRLFDELLYLFYNNYKINNNDTSERAVSKYLSVVRVLGGGASLSGNDVGGGGGIHNNQLNLVDTSVKSSRAVSEVLLASSSGNGQLKVEGVASSNRDTLNGSDVFHAVETRSGRTGNLTHQLAADVGGGGQGVGAVLVGRSSTGGMSLVDGFKSALDATASGGTLADKVRKESFLIAKQINTVRSVEELQGQITKKIVLDEVLRGNNGFRSNQNRAGCSTISRHSSVDGVQLQGGGPKALVHVILDIGCVDVVDIERVRLELEDVEHIRQPHVVDGDGADIP